MAAHAVARAACAALLVSTLALLPGRSWRAARARGPGRAHYDAQAPCGSPCFSSSRGSASSEVNFPERADGAVAAPRRLDLSFVFEFPNGSAINVDHDKLNQILHENLQKDPDLKDLTATIEQITEVEDDSSEVTESTDAPSPTPSPLSTAAPPTPEPTTTAKTTEEPSTTTTKELATTRPTTTTAAPAPTQAPASAPTAAPTAEPTAAPLTTTPAPTPTPTAATPIPAAPESDAGPDIMMLVKGIDFGDLDTQLQNDIKKSAQDCFAGVIPGTRPEDFIVDLKQGSLRIEGALPNLPTSMTREKLQQQLRSSTDLPGTLASELEKVPNIEQASDGGITAEVVSSGGRVDAASVDDGSDNGDDGGRRGGGGLPVKLIIMAVVGALALVLVAGGVVCLRRGKDRGFTRLESDEEDRPKLVFHAIVVPGGGLTKSGLPPPWVQERLKKAKALYEDSLKPDGEKPHIITLSAGGKPQAKSAEDIDAGGTEAQANANYLVDQLGSPRQHVFEETLSHDLVSNAYFLRTMHTDVSSLKEIAIINNKFQMNQSKIIFEKVFKLGPMPPGLPDGYNLQFFEVEDTGLDGPTLAARKDAEAKAIQAFIQASRTWKVLDNVHQYIFAKEKDDDDSDSSSDKSEKKNDDDDSDEDDKKDDDDDEDEEDEEDDKKDDSDDSDDSSKKGSKDGKKGAASSKKDDDDVVGLKRAGR